MYKLCKTEESSLRQHLLEQGLLEMMKRMPYGDITVSDLCSAMQIPRKSFYRYFSGKDGALHAMIDHTLMSFETDGAQSLEGTCALQTQLERFFQFWLRNRSFLEALDTNGLSSILLERAIVYSVSEGVFPVKPVPGEDLQIQRQATMFGVCGLMSMVLQWHRQAYHVSAQQMAAVALRLLTQPLFLHD